MQKFINAVSNFLAITTLGQNASSTFQSVGTTIGSTSS
jgi:hypothetical protein